MFLQPLSTRDNLFVLYSDCSENHSLLRELLSLGNNNVVEFPESADMMPPKGSEIFWRLFLFSNMQA